MGCSSRLGIPHMHDHPHPSSPPGDLFTALLLAWLHRYPDDLKTALELAVAGLQEVLLDTVARCGSGAAASKDRDAAVCRARELRLVQNQDALIAPTVRHRAEPL